MSRNEIKVVIVGDKGVGKSTLVNMYVGGTFHIHTSTIGCDLFRKNFGARGSVTFWDLQGQETPSVTPPMFIRNASAAIVVTLATAPTRARIEQWKVLLNSHGLGEIPCALICNKMDLVPPRRSIQFDDDLDMELERIRLQCGMSEVFYTSAMQRVGVDDAFDRVAESAFDFSEGRYAEFGSVVSLSSAWRKSMAGVKRGGGWCC